MIKKIKWWIKGHLEWKYGWEWLEMSKSNDDFGTYIPEELWYERISAYKFWKEYSCSNGC